MIPDNKIGKTFVQIVLPISLKRKTGHVCDLYYLLTYPKHHVYIYFRSAFDQPNNPSLLPQGEQLCRNCIFNLI